MTEKIIKGTISRLVDFIVLAIFMFLVSHSLNFLVVTWKTVIDTYIILLLLRHAYNIITE